MEGLLISAYKLDVKMVEKLEHKFSKEIGEEVKLRQEVDRSLIGGFIVSIRHHRYDYSVRNELHEMKKFLLEN